MVKLNLFHYIERRPEDNTLCNHIFRYTGKIPCTGIKRCAICGEREDEKVVRETGKGAGCNQNEDACKRQGGEDACTGRRVGNKASRNFHVKVTKMPSGTRHLGSGCEKKEW